MGYSTATEEKHAKALKYDLDVSYKQLSQVCGNLQGTYATSAVSFLEDVIKGNRFVIFRKFNKKMGARKGGRKGRFPGKAARIALMVLRNAIANAEFKGMDPERLFILFANANLQASFPRTMAVGRWMRHDFETSKMEIVLVEKGKTEEKEQKEGKIETEGKEAAEEKKDEGKEIEEASEEEKEEADEEKKEEKKKEKEAKKEKKKKEKTKKETPEKKKTPKKKAKK